MDFLFLCSSLTGSKQIFIENIDLHTLNPLKGFLKQDNINVLLINTNSYKAS